MDKGFTKWDKNADSAIEKWFVGKYSSYDAILVANATPISKTTYSLQMMLEFDYDSELNVAEQYLKEKLKSDYKAERPMEMLGLSKQRKVKSLFTKTSIISHHSRFFFRTLRISRNI